MIIKIVLLFLAGMVVLALFGKRTPRGGTPRSQGQGAYSPSRPDRPSARARRRPSDKA